MVALLPMLLALAPAKAQTIVYEGVTTQLNINAVAGNTYAWKIYNDATLDFSLESSPGCPVTSANFTTGNTGSSVQVLSLIHISEHTRLGMISYAVFCL